MTAARNVLLREKPPADDKPAVSRTYNRQFDTHAVRLLPGDYYATGAKDEMIVTVLGSCVAACIRNPFTGYGGMNHFMLPESSSGEWNGVGTAMRYGNYAMEALINDVLKAGCLRCDLEIKLFGGACLSEGPLMVGDKNVEFALDYLKVEGLRVMTHDLGGDRGRRIHYFPATGAIKRLLLKPAKEAKVLREEQRYVSTLQTLPVEGEIDLFD